MRCLKIQGALLSIASIIFISILIQQTVMVSGQNPTQMSGKVFSNEAMNVSSSAFNRGIWTDDQWEYYTAEVKKGYSIDLILEYEGDLDLDMRLYVDEVNPLDTNTYGWDITHCGIPNDPLPARNSQNRGYDGIESINYYNQIWNVNRTVWILVFCYGSEVPGNSLYTLTSNITLTRVSSYNLQQCFGIREAWIVFGVCLAAITVVFLVIGKRAKMPREQKTLRKIEGQKKKANKVEEKREKSPVKKVSMKARGSSTRRR